MKSEYYYSDCPEEDIWLNLKHYSYIENIKRYFSEKGLEVNDDLSEVISGSILQAYEYFEASKSASLQTAPLLLYYGSINLLYGSSCLLSGIKLEVKGHGMRLGSNEQLKAILENKVKVINTDFGGFSTYVNALEATQVTESIEFTISELLSSIPEIHKEYVNLFGIERSYVLPLEKVISENETTLRVDLKSVSQDVMESMLNNVTGYNLNYHKYRVNNNDQAILQTKLNGIDISIQSYHGNFYFPVSHQNSNFNSFFLQFIALFGLGTLCRYHTEVWTPFIRLDTSGEVNLIEKFLNSTRRYFPNYILDKITGVKHFYSNKLYMPINSKNMLSEGELSRKIKQELRKMGVSLNENF